MNIAQVPFALAILALALALLCAIPSSGQFTLTDEDDFDR
jgi:hypothetical protein